MVELGLAVGPKGRLLATVQARGKSHRRVAAAAQVEAVGLASPHGPEGGTAAQTTAQTGGTSAGVGDAVLLLGGTLGGVGVELAAVDGVEALVVLDVARADLCSGGIEEGRAVDDEGPFACARLDRGCWAAEGAGEVLEVGAASGGRGRGVVGVARVVADGSVGSTCVGILKY